MEVLSESDFEFVSTVYRSEKTHVYKAINSDGKSMLFKQSESLDSGFAQYGSCNEWRISRDLDDKYIVKPIEIYKFNRHLLLGFSDEKYSPLSESLLEGGYCFEQLIDIFIGLASCLHSIHQSGVIHRDVNPSNVVESQVDGSLKLIDFEHACGMAEQEQGFTATAKMKGTLAYISPEQTGRISRSTDHRADLYSLGATIFELASGKKVFPYEDPAQLVYAHLAQSPPLLLDVKKDISKALSDVVAKLLEKDPDRRYQSAELLLNDLEFIQSSVRDKAGLDGFVAAESLQGPKIVLSNSVFGRDEERLALLDCYQDSANKFQLACLKGNAGVGKTALIRDLFTDFSGNNSFYLAGKFDQLSKGQAYTAIAAALGEFVDQALSDMTVAWKELLSATVQGDGTLLTGIVPSFKALIGSQAEAPVMGAKEIRARRNYLFKKLFIDICQKLHEQGRSLVVFIDDLQWADSASIELLDSVIKEKAPGLMLILSYRGEEITQNPAAETLCESFAGGNQGAKNIDLLPLNVAKISQWVSTQLSLQEDDGFKLAEQLYLRSEGNPFHIRYLIRVIIEEEIVRRDEGLSQIDWPLVSNLPILTADEFVAEKISNLVTDQREFIEKVSILGNSFSLTKIEKLLAQEYDDFEGVLKALIAQQLMIKAGNSVCFSHDKIQQAAARLLDKNLSRNLKLSLAKTLLDDALKKHPNKAIAGYIDRSQFSVEEWSLLGECLYYYNSVQELVELAEQRQLLAILNLGFAEHLMSQAASSQAESILMKAKSLLPASGEELVYSPLAAEVCVAIAQLQVGRGEHDSGEALFDWVLANARCSDEKIGAYQAKLVYLSSELRTEEATQLLREMLVSIGVSVPENVTSWHHVKAYLSTILTPGAKQPEEIVSMPSMTDSKIVKVMHALSSCLMAAYMSATEYFPLILCHMLKLTLRFGVSPYLGHVLVGFGIINIAFNNYKLAQRYGLSALKALDRFENREADVFVNIAYGSLIHHWYEPLRECEEYLDRGFKAACEMGDYETANVVVTIIMSQNFICGLSLDFLHEKHSRFIDYIQRHNDSVLFHHNDMARQIYQTISDKSGDGITIVGDYFDETQLAEFTQEQGDNTFISGYLADKSLMHILRHEYVDAFHLSRRALGGAISKSIGSYFLSSLYFCGAFSALECILSKVELPKAKKQLRLCRGKLKTFSGQYAPNYRSKLLILEARESELKTDFSKSLFAYKKAVEFCYRYGVLQEQGILHELYGRFLLRHDFSDLAQAQLKLAAEAYGRWGARQKIKHMFAEYDCFKSPSGKYGEGLSVSSVNDAKDSMDFESLSQSVELLSSSLDENKLISGLMRALVMNSGASRAVYMSCSEGIVRVRSSLLGETESYHYQGSEALLANFDLPTELIEKCFLRTKKEYIGNHVKNGTEVSVLVLPVQRQGRLAAVVYLENELIQNAFRKDQLKVLRLLAGQAAIALENASAFSELNSERQHNENVINNLPMMVFAMTEDASIRYANPEAIRVTEYSEQEILGGSWWKKQQSGMSKRQRQEVSRLIITGKMDNYEYPIRSKNGEERIVLWTSVVKKLGDTGRQVILFGVDATAEIKAKREMLNFNESLKEKVYERTKELERSFVELKETQDKLVESEKTAALSGLVAGVAHEINTPIGVGVTGATKLMESTQEIVNSYESGVMVQSELEAYLKQTCSLTELTYNNLCRAADLVKSFKQISVDQTTEVKRVFFIEDYFVQIFQSLHAQHAHRKINVSVNCKDNFEVNSYPGLYAQVITNLLMNSLVHAFEEEEEGNVNVDLSRDHECIYINYRDNGKGISESNISKIFNPFFTTNNQGGGTGLGLNIVYNIVTQNLCGELECRSKLGDGAEFLIKLPIDLDKAQS